MIVAIFIYNHWIARLSGYFSGCNWGRHCSAEQVLDQFWAYRSPGAHREVRLLHAPVDMCAKIVPGFRMWVIFAMQPDVQTIRCWQHLALKKQVQVSWDGHPGRLAQSGGAAPTDCSRCSSGSQWGHSEWTLVHFWLFVSKFPFAGLNGVDRWFILIDST